MKKYISDFKIRFSYLFQMFKSIDFILALTIFLFFIYSFLYKKEYEDNLLFVIPAVILMSIVLYDLFISYSIFNIKCFNVRAEIIKEIKEIKEKIEEDIFEYDSSKKEDMLISELGNEIKKTKLVKRFLLKLDAASLVMLTSIKMFLIKYFSIKKNFHSFLDKIFYLLKKPIMLFLSFLAKQLISIIKAVFVIISFVLIIYLYSKYSSSYSNMEELYSYINEKEYLSIKLDENNFWIPSLLLFLGIYLVFFIIDIIKNIPRYIKYIIFLVKTLPIIFILILLFQSFDSLGYFSVLDQLKDYLPKLSASEKINSLIFDLFLDATVLFFVLSFYFIKSINMFFRLLSYIYLLILSILVFLFSSESIFILLVCYLFVFSVQKRLDFKLTYCVLIIFLDLIGLEYSVIYQIIFSVFVVITDYNKGSSILEKNLFLQSLKGKYLMLLEINFPEEINYISSVENNNRRIEPVF